MIASVCPRCGAELASGSSAAGLCPACLFGSALSGSDLSDDFFGATLLPGTTLGPFRIVRLLGTGGMAAVYEAQDPGLERAVALKVLPPEFLHDGAFARRFQQEARVIAKLEHPNIVPIYASGIDEGIPWMSMRLLTGGNIGMLLERRRPEPFRAVQILRDVAAAIDYAHARGVVHRDIKPTNLLLDGSDAVCVADFGLAFLLEGSPGLTRPGTLAGTPHYMAPEQALGKPADHRCDIYSLGIVAYEMFAGAMPFTAASPVAVLLKHVNEVLPEPPAGLVPRHVMRVIEKAAAKDPAERWPSAGAFAAALAEAVGVTPEDAAAHSVNERQHRSPRSRAARLGVAAGGLLTIAGLAWFVTREPLGHPAPANPGPTEQPSVAAQPNAPAPVPVQDADVPPGVSVPAPAPRRSRAVQVAPPPQPDIAEPLVESAPRPAGAPATDHVPAATAADSRTPVLTSNVSPATAVADVIKAPVRIRTVSPDYPTAARAARLEGDVVLQATVGVDGRVSDVVVVRSVHPLLDQAARKAVLQYEYAPGRRNESPESSTVQITVSFRMR